MKRGARIYKVTRGCTGVGWELWETTARSKTWRFRGAYLFWPRAKGSVRA